MSCSYFVFRRWTIGLVNFFFRRVDVVGSFRVPKDGPLILVANHANQFVDPMMLVNCVNRAVHFLIAAKSLRRPIIGHLAWCAGSIGVERPQDLAKKGAGTVSAEAGSCTVRGEGTNFSSVLQPGAKLKIKTDLEVTVKSIESDVSCTVAPVQEAFSAASFKVLPYVDQKAVFSKVHQALKAGEVIGIFPEGGSHDQTRLLELKPGVAIMALGAMEAGSPPVRICPCGLNYFEAYKFRSRVVVECGEAFEVPLELAERYKTDKRGAVKALMGMIEERMEGVIPSVPSFADLQAIITMRALYKPSDRRLTPEENLRMTKNFRKCARLLKDNEEMKKTLELIAEYNDLLRAAGCKDRDVSMKLTPKMAICCPFVWAFLKLVLLAVPAMALFVISSPPMLVAYLCALREKRTALAGSVVKVKALDVVASYKILVSLVVMPLYALLLTFVVVWLTDIKWTWGILIFVSFPVVGYIAAKICDAFAKALSDCRAMMWSCRGAGSDLLERRVALQLRIRRLVEELGPTVIEDFEGGRVISRSSLLRDNSALQDAGLVPQTFDYLVDLEKPLLD